MKLKTAASSFGNGLLNAACAVGNAMIQNQIDEIDSEMDALRKQLTTLQERKTKLEEQKS